MERWRRIDAATGDEAAEWLRTCCAAPQWVERMCARRPFGTANAVLAAAREEWFALSEDDWRDAFSHHPRIGDRDALRDRFATTRDLSQREQSGVQGAADDVLAALAKANREYEARFGYVFLICATGLTAEEMLESLRARMQNDPATEIRVAAAEHARICALRLLTV
ncbi:MAG: 2-oxo-4-hydroxy-4-carboxy-5-ureidoimidazoline decarboxylase [Acidobacteria bacterium]|nr:2-oxo-4-hydroxy-4-carboxy-5-ureidoimidazoline decarboxylase [Acidobacteriota bacterium]MCA1651538.1 2-oxo-4-hydroxy-4-carboxy-5-ureidoimidazoline decarboxylase [Acidobacteriota bacterium]